MFRRFSEKLLKKRLNNVDPENIPRFSFDGFITYAKVINVYDGDTITIIFEYKGEMIKYSCRIYGIDTPEIRTRDADEKKRGYLARDFLREYIHNQIVQIEFLKFDKYGRPLINVFFDIDNNKVNIAEFMINNGHGKPYFGGKK